jgi:hypothetical protein
MLAIIVAAPEAVTSSAARLIVFTPKVLSLIQDRDLQQAASSQLRRASS